MATYTAPKTYELTAYAPGTRGTWIADIRKTYRDYYAAQAEYNRLSERGYRCYLVRCDRNG